MNKKIVYALAMTMVAAITPQSSQAQDDLGIWASVGAEKKINKKWSAGLEFEYRTRDEALTIDRLSYGADVSYKITKWLEAGAGYTLLRDNVQKYSYHEDGSYNKVAKFWRTRHRAFFGLTAEKDLGRFTVSLRERWQYTYRPEKSVDERYDFDKRKLDGKPKTYSGKGANVLRSRLQLSYSIPDCNVEPYLSAEVYNNWSVDKVKYTAGFDWKFAKHHKVGLYYRYNKIYGEDEDEDPNMHVVGLEYKYKF